MEKPRCFTLFLESCSTKSTKKNYSYQLKRFLEWAHKDYASILLLTKSELNELLEDYALYLKRTVSPNSLETYFAGVFQYLDFNDREYSKKRINRLLNAELERRGGERPIKSKELLEMDRTAPTTRVRAILRIFAFTGMRPEALAELKIIDAEEMPDGFLCLWIYATTNKRKPVFIPPQVVQVLKQYHEERRENGEKLTSESYVISSEYDFVTLKHKPISSPSMARIMVTMMSRAKVKRVKVSKNRFDLASCGCVRKRFNTILKENPDISFAIAEKLMDHNSPLERAYTVPTRDKLFQEYKKAVNDLEFDPTRKLEIENLQLKQENETVQRIKTNFETYESRMVELINDALTDPEGFKKKVSEFRKQNNE